MTDIVVRFVVGGLAVCGFSVLADILRPKSFAGLFGAAPSIALASLGIAIAQHGAEYAASEGRSMAVGAVALWLYSAGACWLMGTHKLSALPASATMLSTWLICAFALKSLLVGAS